jgi:triosephosphate isomerase
MTAVAGMKPRNNGEVPFQFFFKNMLAIGFVAFPIVCGLVIGGKSLIDALGQSGPYQQPASAAPETYDSCSNGSTRMILPQHADISIDDEPTDYNSSSSSGVASEDLEARSDDSLGETTDYNSSSFFSDASHDAGATYKEVQVSTRKFLIAANYKSGPKTLKEVLRFLKLLKINISQLVQDTKGPLPMDIVIFPPFPFLAPVLDELEGTGIKVGAQNLGMTKHTYTGEVSASMIQSLGCDYVMVGHSERRFVFQETDLDINTKLLAALEQSTLNVLLHVGESRKDFENDKVEQALISQIRTCLQGVDKKDLERIVVVYDPSHGPGFNQRHDDEHNDAQISNANDSLVHHIVKARDVIRFAVGELYGNGVTNSLQIQHVGDTIQQIMPGTYGISVDETTSLNIGSFLEIIDQSIEFIGSHSTSETDASATPSNNTLLPFGGIKRTSSSKAATRARYIVVPSETERRSKESMRPYVIFAAFLSIVILSKRINLHISFKS